jgi:hypothetical protein
MHSKSWQPPETATKIDSPTLKFQNAISARLFDLPEDEVVRGRGGQGAL